MTVYKVKLNRVLLLCYRNDDDDFNYNILSYNLIEVSNIFHLKFLERNGYSIVDDVIKGNYWAYIDIEHTNISNIKAEYLRIKLVSLLRNDKINILVNG